MMRWTSGFWVRAAIACVEQTRADQQLVRSAIGATLVAELRLRRRPSRAASAERLSIDLSGIGDAWLGAQR